MTRVTVPKLLDEFILPVCLVLAARFLGVFFVGLIWPIGFTFSLRFDLLSLPFIRFGKEADLLVANSFSWGFVGLTLAAVFGFVLFRALIFHQEHLHPKEAARAHNKHLEFLIIDPKDVSSQCISWVILILVATAFATADFLAGSLLAATLGLLVGIGLALVLVFWQGIAQRAS